MLSTHAPLLGRNALHGILEHFSLFCRICANLRREIGDTSVQADAPAAEAQAPQPMDVGGGSSGDNASLYD
jgi:hypothetical protein